MSTTTHDLEHEDTATERGPSVDVAAVLVAHRAAFLAFVERRVGDPVLAEDLLQAAFARSLDRLETLRSEASAVAWFYRVLRNAIVDMWRRRGAASRALEALSAELSSTDIDVVDTDDATCGCVARLARTLKPEYAEALQRIEVDGLAVKSFAEEAGISNNNAGVRIFRAREALRRQVVATCGACAAHGCVDCTCSAPTMQGAG